MSKISSYAIAAASVLAASASAASAQVVPLPISLGDPLNSGTPFADSAVLALIAVGVIGGIWLVRRKQ